ncbi:MAG: ABC-F family ATP-binding cassette domain-containing protein [Acidobacteriota bacterium]
MIQIDRIEKRFGPQILFSNLSWHIRPGERIGLVGPNGAGKTTLLRILHGDEDPDAGRVHRARGITLGYLPQEVMELSGGTILEQVLAGHQEVAALEHRMHSLAEQLALRPGRPEAERLTDQYGQAQERFAALGGYDLEARARAVLTGLGFDPGRMDRSISELSGGWQMRVALARLLLKDPDLLLLDEPTNHLDLESLTWFEEFLRGRKGAFVVISHDRYFLNRMVSRIGDLSGARLSLFTGNYDRYVQEKEARFAAVTAAASKQAREIERMTRFVERFRYQASKARQVQSRVRMLERMERVEAPARESRAVKFRFPQPPRSGSLVVELHRLVKRYGEKEVYGGVDFSLHRGDRVALVGPNGAGKSTLLKILSGVLSFEGGQRRCGHNVTLAYYTQHALDALQPGNTVFGELSGAAETAMQPHLRGLLAAFLFDADEWEKKVAVLSGGEKARLALAKLLLRPANLLLLDEPTNHLDLRSRDVLEKALSEYTGTLCFISHDRYFINRIATSVCAVNHGTLDLYPGHYDDYLRQARSPAASPPAPGTVSPPTRPPEAQRETARQATGRTPTREEKRRQAEVRRRFSQATRELREQLQTLEERITREERKLRAVEYEMADPSTYRHPEKARSAARLQAELKKSITALTTQWEQLSARLEEEQQRHQDELNSLAG